MSWFLGQDLQIRYQNFSTTDLFFFPLHLHQIQVAFFIILKVYSVNAVNQLYDHCQYFYNWNTIKGILVKPK